MRIRLDNINGFIKVPDKIRYLVLFDYSYLISEISAITDSINHNFAGFRIDSYNSLPIEKILTFHNVLIPIKSAVNKKKNEYYHNIFLEKVSYKDKSNTEYFINECLYIIIFIF